MNIKKEITTSVTGLLILLMTGLFSPILSARTFKIATITPDGTYWMKQMRAGAKEISEKTQGRVKFKFYPGGVMGSDDSVMRKIRIHQLQGGAVTNGTLEKINRDVTIYGLPFVFSSFQEAEKVRQKTDPLLLQGLEKHGFVSFGFATGGFTYIMSKYPIDSIKSLHTLKPWVPEGNEIGYDVYEQAGVSPVSLPLSDVLTGLQTKLIDTIVTSPIGALALQWHTGVKYVVDLPLTYLLAAMIVDKKSFDHLSKADQATVREVMGDVYKRIDKHNVRDSINARKALKNQGIKFISLSKDQLKKWYAIGEKVRQEIYQKYHFDKVLYEKIIAH